MAVEDEMQKSTEPPSHRSLLSYRQTCRSLIRPTFPSGEDLEHCSPLPLAVEVPIVLRARCQCLPCHSSVFPPTWSAWGTRLPYLQRSLDHTSAQLIVLAVKHGEVTPREQEMAALESRMRSLGIGATVVRALRNSLM